MTDEGRLLLYAIQRATKTLSLITNNVLDWSRLDKDGEATCRPVSVDIRTTCESIITLLPNQDEDVDVDLYVVVAHDVPHAIFIDETYIHRILMNLLSNALKFTSAGYILLLVEMKDGNLVASVTDTGCGVPPAFLPQLFEPFKQAQTRGRARGTGLGLSIIKQLLRKMGGNIDVESRYQDEEDVGPLTSGSCFTITIPVPPPDTQHQHDDHRLHKIAVIHRGTDRALEGLKTAWEKFGFEVVVGIDSLEISGSDLDYIWVDLPSLKGHPNLLHQLMKRSESMVLIPYEVQSALSEVPGLLQASQHIVPVQKPLVLHSIEKRVTIAGLQPGKGNLPRTVRFDPVVTDLEEPQDAVEPSESLSRQQSFAEVQTLVDTVIKEPSPKKDRVVLLVEDNPVGYSLFKEYMTHQADKYPQINCKLGRRMLQSLGYQVLVAEDGVLAIEQILKHDATVDAILMDQSMPRKDGLTTTKEIREMEANGTLSRIRPIIAVSAVVSVESQSLFRLAGANDFLAKPLSLGRLERSLSAHLHVGVQTE